MRLRFSLRELETFIAIADYGTFAAAGEAIGLTQSAISMQIKSLEVDDGCSVIAGNASMESYVQAWHELKNGKVWLFLGTYFDDVEYVTNEGWRITETTLQQVAGETRHMDKAAGLAADS